MAVTMVIFFSWTMPSRVPSFSPPCPGSMTMVTLSPVSCALGAAVASIELQKKQAVTRLTVQIIVLTNSLFCFLLTFIMSIPLFLKNQLSAENWFYDYITFKSSLASSALSIPSKSSSTGWSSLRLDWIISRY